jgi:MFS family permease
VALLSPFAGILVDRYGRRKLILAATLFYGLAGVAPFFAHDLAAMFATRLVVGVAEGFVLIIVNTLFADYYGPTGRRTWITVQGVSGPFLGAASIGLAGLLTGMAWNGAFLIYGSALLIALVMTFTLFEPEVGPLAKADATAREQSASPFPTRSAILFCFVTFMSSLLLYVYIVQSGLAFEAAGVTSAAQLGLLIGLCSLGAPVGALIFNFVSRRSGGASLIATFLTLMGVGLAGIGLARSPLPMAAAAFLQQAGTGMTVTSLIFWVSSLLPAEHRGRGFGLWNSAFFSGQFASPLFFGLVRHGSGSVLHAFAVCGLFALCGAVIVMLARQALEPAPPQAFEIV